jgi:hypothetical protein
VIAVTKPRDAASGSYVIWLGRRRDSGERSDQGSYTTATSTADRLCGTHAYAAGPADQSGSGGGAPGRVVTAADPAWPSTSDTAAGPTYPASPVPAPIDQQKTQSYRNDLIIQRFQLDRLGVSPDNERYREIQRQLNQPGSR